MYRIAFCLALSIQLLIVNCAARAPVSQSSALFLRGQSSFWGQYTDLATAAAAGAAALVILALILFWLLRLRGKNLASQRTATQLQHIIDALPISIAVTEDDGTILLANEQCNKEAGLEESLMGQNVNSFYEDPQSRAKLVERLPSEKRISGEPVRYRKPNGKLFEGLLSMTRISYGRGEATLAAMLNVTERLRMERDLAAAAEGLRDSETQLQRILDAIPAAIMVSKDDGEILFANRQAAVELECECGIVGKNTEDIHADPEARSKVLKQFRRVRRIDAVPMKYVTVNGREVEGLLSMSPIQFGSEEANLSTVINVTERLRMERELEQTAEALRQSERKFRAVFDQSFQYTGLMNPDGVLLEANQTALGSIGAQRSDLIGLPFWKTRWWTHSKEAQATVQKMCAKAAQGELARAELQFPGADGNTITVDTSIKPVFDEAGRVILLMPEARDISETKRNQRDLRRAKEAAEEANRFKSQFLANMSHEIRTPMNAIVGMSHLAMLTDLSDKQRDYINNIQNAGQSLLGLINDILDLSKIEAGELSMESVDFGLDQVLDNLADLFRLKAEEQGLELLLDVRPGVPFALIGDPLRLGQILTNLVSNALKFTQQGEVIVRVELDNQTEHRGRLVFSVIDSGAGIEPAKLSKLFDSFYQGDASTTRTHGGTGLGLAITRNLVSMMNGDIDVDSAVGKGSTFRFTAEFGVQPNGAGFQWTLPADMSAIRVLVVDGNPSARDVLAAMLTRFSCKVAAAGCAEEAFETIRSRDQKYDLIVMDWQTPETDGFEATRLIRQTEAHARPPIILMVTAHGRDDVLPKAEEMNPQGFLVKPVSPWALYEIIVGLRRGAASSAEPTTTAEAMPENKKFSARILLVEDNEINRQVAREMLENLGARVEIAKDGADAVEMACERRFDLLLMDIQMPEMDGLEATRKIRQRGITDVPIIAMTAHALLEDREKSLRAGMNDHITKPIHPEALYNTLKRWLEQDLDNSITGQPAVYPDAASPRDHSEPIDYRFGLELAGGNRVLFRELLLGFHANHGEDIKLIRQAIKERRIDDVARLLHTIIGIAGNIGATNVVKSARVCESFLHQGETDSLRVAINDFSEAFEALMNWLNTDAMNRKNPSGGADQNTTN